MNHQLIKRVSSVIDNLIDLTNFSLVNHLFHNQSKSSIDSFPRSTLQTWMRNDYIVFSISQHHQLPKSIRKDLNFGTLLQLRHNYYFDRYNGLVIQFLILSRKCIIKIKSKNHSAFFVYQFDSDVDGISMRQLESGILRLLIDPLNQVLVFDFTNLNRISLNLIQISSTLLIHLINNDESSSKKAMIVSGDVATGGHICYCDGSIEYFDPFSSKASQMWKPKLPIEPKECIRFANTNDHFLMIGDESQRSGMNAAIIHVKSKTKTVIHQFHRLIQYNHEKHTIIANVVVFYFPFFARRKT